MSSSSDLVHLASKLREEHIFVKAETLQLSRLNTQLATSIENLYHEAWIARSQRRALEILMAQRNDIPADTCLQRLNSAALSTPVDGYRILGHKESAYGECLKVVRENPELLAECLVRGERGNSEKMQEALRIVLGSLYGYGLIPEDQEYSRKLLKSLVEIQLDANSNPRRLLNNVSTFSYAYKIFVENLHETKLYLAAALHEPILQVLVEDDLYLDVDPSKAILRFTDEERIRRFGPVVGCDFYNRKVHEHHQIVMTRLVKLVKRFIQGLVDNLFCFPPSLCWVISQVYERIQSQHPSQPTLPAVVCTDLIFAQFICPAIIQPELYALTSDIPVSKVAGVNLMQIAQVLQTLAVSKWEKTDPKHGEIYDSVDPSTVWSFLDSILEMRTSDILVPPQLPSDCVSRSSVLMSLVELNILVSFLKDVSADKPGSRVQSDIFRKVVSSLPPVDIQPKKEQLAGGIPSGSTSNGKVRKSRLPNRLSDGNHHGDDSESESTTGSVGNGAAANHTNQVLSISLGAKENGELGLLSEQKVLALSKRSAKKRLRSSEYNESFDVGSVDDEAMSAFSVCSSIPDSVSVTGRVKQNGQPARLDDTSSIAPSDALRAVSEEAGPHSIASSVEGGLEQDNLSDASASISARASPSVSGRDTPSPPQEDVAQINPPSVSLNENVLLHLLQPRDLPVTVQKQNREDVPDRFGKFYIPVDETRSTMSDAWSTEVAGSEFDPFNELAGANQQPPPNQIIDPVFAVAAAGAFDSDNDDPVLAVAAAGGFDSDNDDRWSVDVAASVSNASQEPLEDRMAELENEDLIGLDGPPIVDVATPLPVLPNPSAKYVSFANDDKFHHYPSENDLLDHSFSSGGATFGDRTNRDFEEDDDPTVNLPMNVFAPVPVMPEHPFGGSVPSSCSSFSNLSGFSSFESDHDRASGLAKRSGTDGSMEVFAPPVFATGSDANLISPQKPPSIGRKGSLCKENVILKETATRQLSFGGTFSTSPASSSNIINGVSASSGGKKPNFFKTLATNIRGKPKRSSTKAESSQMLVETNTPQAQKPPGPVMESPDDILAKYRKKTVLPHDASVSPLIQHASVDVPGSTIDNICLVDFAGISEDALLETAKRKVRIVLNSFDLASVHCLKMRLLNKSGKENDPALLSLLKIQLSEAIGLQDRSLVAQLHEAIRCVKVLDAKSTKLLVESLRADYRGRDVYIAYLIRCRKTLLNSTQHIEKLISKTKRDGNVCSKYFFSVCVSRFLEKRDPNIRGFIQEFQDLSLSDEKTALVESFLNELHQKMILESLWQKSNQQQMLDARETLERQIMSQVYLSALYPNGDVDRMRDQMLHDHIKKLARSLTPDHKDLKISKVFHLECPWPSAQAEIIAINAYKTPKDKVQCVVRCSATLMNLLSMAADSSIPAADDFMPALVYVLIRANPPSLLSTVQYVNNFYGKRLAGEESYWWTQFASCIEYIKNMH